MSEIVPLEAIKLPVGCLHSVDLKCDHTKKKKEKFQHFNWRDSSAFYQQYNMSVNGPRSSNRP